MPADMLASLGRFRIEVEHHGVVAGWIGPRGPAWMGHMAQSQRQAHELPAIGRVSYLRPISDSSQPAGQGWSGGAAGQGHGGVKDRGISLLSIIEIPHVARHPDGGLTTAWSLASPPRR